MLKAILFDRNTIADHLRHQTGTKWVLHVPSTSKLLEIFCIAGLHGTACYKLINNRRHCFFGCGKIILKDPNGGSILGYVVDEYTTATGSNRWRVDTVGGTTIQMNALQPVG